jgi:predicted alpha/beta-fold hydrolase
MQYRQKTYKSRIEILTVKDGSQLAMAWYVCPKYTQRQGQKEFKSRQNPLLVIYPGLSGSQESLYCQSLI